MNFGRKNLLAIANLGGALQRTCAKTDHMKTILLLLTLVFGVSLTVTLAQPKRNRAPKECMRDKLELSQQILEGLALEDFDLIFARAVKLSAMSKEADWRVFENPDYDQQSVLFRRQVNALTRAAKEKNLDAATLAYVRITMSCVDCHKLVRGKLVAELKPSSTRKQKAL